MSFSDLRAGLFVGYVVLVVWRISVGAPEGYWPYTLAFAVLSGITRAIEHSVEEHRIRRDVAYLASLDPESAQKRIDQFWSAHARRTYRELLGEEGAVERDGAVERFPYATSERRSWDQLFWFMAVVAAAAFVALFTVARRGTWLPWMLWAIGAVCVGAAGWARYRTSEITSTLELTPFGLTWIGHDGSRRGVRWTEPLTLQNQPRKRRVMIASERGTVVPLGYRRVGFERLLRRTIELGGFAAIPQPPDDSTAGEAQAPNVDIDRSNSGDDTE